MHGPTTRPSIIERSRFVLRRLDPMSEQVQDLEMTSGLLRPAAAEILFLHSDAAAFGPEQWALLHRLTVAGGLAGGLPRRRRGG